MKIIFFDGYCNLCNNWVDWVIKNDSKAEFKFASLQGEEAKKLIPDIQLLESGEPDSIIYLRDGEKFERSTAVLNILKDLKSFYPANLTLVLFPKFLRDFIYKLVAKNRYLIFGKRDTCRIPTPEERARFLP